MIVKIQTRHLVGMLTDLLRTASTLEEFPHVNAVLLFGDRADIAHDDVKPGDEAKDEDTLGVEFGPTDVLVGTSADLSIMAQCFAPCTGRLTSPILITAADAKAITQRFEPLRKKFPKSKGAHITVLDLSGGVLRVSEDPTLTHTPRVLTFNVLGDEHLENFPDVEKVATINVGEEVKRDGKIVAATWGRGVYGHHWQALAAVAKRRKMTPVWYQHHQLRPARVTIGGWYWAAPVPTTADLEPEALDGPLVETFVPFLPRKAKESDQQMLDTAVAG